MKKREKTAFLFNFVVLKVAICAFAATALAQTPSITATVSQTNIQPNQNITITLGVDIPVDAFYFGVEVTFDPQIFEFVGESETGLMSGGISIADLLTGNKVGASVTLTSPLVSPASGDLLQLTFRVKQAASVGSADFNFSNTELYNSTGLQIVSLAPPAPTVQIDEGVSDLRLGIPPVNQITEGEALSVNGSVYVNDITVDESVESSRISLWVGVNSTDTDPAAWNETTWLPMNFDSQQGSYHLYQQDIGFMIEPGTYFIALRAQLDSQSYVYGGQSTSGGGLWDGTENTNAQLTILENPAFRYDLSAWNFDDETLIASRSIPANDDIPFQLVGASLDGFSSGASGQAANADGWQFSEGDEKYWLAVFSTEGFGEITVSSKQYGTGASPRNFEMEASLDSLNWELVSPDTIRVATNWTSGVIENLLLPAGYEDQPNVYIRWIRRGDTRVDGAVGITTGNNRIDEVYIRGENLNPFEVNVWPGDTDDNGEVDELDVIPLGQYWLSAGPVPVYPGVNWVERNVEAWIPEEATYADANGDGSVNYRDLLPVGLNFGETNTGGKVIANKLEPVDELSIRALEAGELISVAIENEEKVALTGISYRFRIEGINPSAWRLKDAIPGEWGKEWLEDDKMISFQRHNAVQTMASVTLIVQGKAKPMTANGLAVFQIEALKGWDSAGRIILERVMVVKDKTMYSLSSAKLVSEAGIIAENEREIPTELQLRQNYPNPFNPNTVITYSLPSDGVASLVLYDLLGREVVTLFNEIQRAGTYDLRFDASNLSSGIYLYRLKAEGKVLTRKLTLIR